MFHRVVCRNAARLLLQHVRKDDLLRTKTVYRSALNIQRCTLHTTANNRWFKQDALDPKKEKRERALVLHHSEIFDEAAQKSKDKATYLTAVKKFMKRSGKYRRGHVEFMYAAMDYMEKFQVHRDIESYKQLLELFPKKTMVTYKTWEVEFMHYPKQQQCCIDVLDKMEENGVCPDDNMGHQLLEIFGSESHAFRKYRRMMYWMPKFKHINPYPIPFHLPDDKIELAVMALRRMAADLQNQVTVFQAEDFPESYDKTFIASAISPTQCELLDKYPVEKSLFVEGGFTVWLRDKQLTYFVLRGDVSDILKHNEEAMANQEKDENLFTWKSMFEEEKPESSLVRAPSVHEQEDGTILGLCITGTASKDSLISWIKFLQDTNPNLRDVPVVFQLRTPEAGLVNKEEEEPAKEMSL